MLLECYVKVTNSSRVALIHPYWLIGRKKQQQPSYLLARARTHARTHTHTQTCARTHTHARTHKDSPAHPKQQQQ